MRQSHLTNVGGLKTTEFPMLVEGSGIGWALNIFEEWREKRNEAVIGLRTVANLC